VYDGKKITVFTHEDKPFENVRSIIEDKKGNIWLGGNDGLWRYDGSSFTNFTQKFVGAIIEDKKGNIWTNGSINAYGQRSTLSQYDRESLSDKKPTVKEIKPKEAGAFCILEANDGSIWFGALGVYRYDGNIITSFNGKEVRNNFFSQ
jgi:ligand-binding sensor domain-containing protein